MTTVMIIIAINVNRINVDNIVIKTSDIVSVQALNEETQSYPTVHERIYTHCLNTLKDIFK